MPGGAETARQIEREVMLQIIDQRWRDHLAEMDYLREGINLRAMGQQDPLVAWQREGFSMFGQLMEGIDDDYLRYVLHVEALLEPAAEPDLDRAVYVAADEPVNDPGMLSAALLRPIAARWSTPLRPHSALGGARGPEAAPPRRRRARRRRPAGRLAPASARFAPGRADAGSTPW